MPEFILLRPPQRTAAAHANLGELPTEEPHRELIPGFWGTAPLENLAAHIALGRSWPEPADARRPPGLEVILTYQDEWEQGADLRFEQLLIGGIEGRYLPVPPEAVELRVDRPAAGSVLGLQRECAELAKALGVPKDHRRVVKALRDSKGEVGEGLWQRYRSETLACLTLYGTCARARREGASMEFGWSYTAKPDDIELTDDSVSYFGFNRFADCRRVEGGAAALFTFCSGTEYRVPVSYLVSWYGIDGDQRELLIRDIRSRPDGDDGAMGIVLTNGRELIVSCDAVLMACEPEYECYGGLTEESRQNIERWTKERGPFRVAAGRRGRSKSD